jgi:hypothetical protein
MATIASTITSSISVKPGQRCLIGMVRDCTEGAQ